MITEVEMLALSYELARVKSEQNIPAALAIYHPDIELDSPSFASVSRGSAQVEKNLHIFFGLFPDSRVTLKQHAINGTVMLASGEVQITPHILHHPCPQISVPVFLELHFKEQRIHKETFFLDMGLICQKAGILPEQLTAAAANHAHSLTPQQDS